MRFSHCIPCRRVVALAWAAAVLSAGGRDALSVDGWRQTHDRVWLGAEFWANPMEDWRVTDGWAECVQGGGNRTIHLLTHQVADSRQSFALEVLVKRVGEGQPGGGAGFRVGIRSELNEYRSNCFAAGGINAGIVTPAAAGNGQGPVPLQMLLGQNTRPLPKVRWAWPLRLALRGEPVAAGMRLRLEVSDSKGTDLGAIEGDFPALDVLGNVALVSNFSDGGPRSQPAQQRQSRHAFTDWRVSGPAFDVDPARRFGPILWSMYTVSDSRGPAGKILTLTALTGPLGAEDDRELALEVAEEAGAWRSLGTAQLDEDAWTATFRISHWDADRATPYRLLLRERWRNAPETVATRTGVIQAEPAGRPLRLAGLTCQNDYAFPYQPLIDNLVKLDPDVLFFSGDQIYESHGGFGVIRSPAEPAILNYLRKYYQFGWAFGDLMRSRPTIVLPDDHDIFQGNVWGEAGRRMVAEPGPGKSFTGGYLQPARMVNVVHRTCTAHHPDHSDRRPVEQGISVYHGDLVYGEVSFAIIADRQFKSGPERVHTDGQRIDHVVAAEFDTAALDKPGLVFLGERQEEFLRRWSADWRGHRMKVLCSQTVFAGLATHHGSYDGYLKADLDSGGWPQSGRNAALRSLAGSRALHVCGDQHLASLVQYGVEQQRDSLWAFCTPAIAVGYPRWWRPDELGVPIAGRPATGMPNTGEYLDGLGNRVFVQAIGNPVVGTSRHRYELAHQKGSGFGMITIDPEARTYKIDAYRFLIDVTDPDPSNQFPGWPVTIHQEEAGDDR